MKEMWKDVEGYEGYYQVSNKGRVKGLERTVYAGRGRTRKQYEKIMSDNKHNGRGYKLVSLSKDGISKNKYIHRLVAEAFIKNGNNFPQVNHKDEDVGNNRVDNLEWCTQKYNNNYGTKKERLSEILRKNNVHCKPVLRISKTGFIIKKYDSINDASKEMNVSSQAISDCLRGKQKHSAGYRWEYV